MKKTASVLLAMLLALTALWGGAAPAKADGNQPVFMWEDCAIQLLDFEITKSSPNDTAHIYLNMRVINSKDYTMSIWMKNADIDGTKVTVSPVTGVEPRSDTGLEDPKHFYIFAPTDNKEAASKAIETARVLTGTLEIHNSETNEVLLSQEISLELDVLSGVRSIPTERPKATQAPTQAPTETPMPDTDAFRPHGEQVGTWYTPMSIDYRTIVKGNQGRDVQDIQTRLTELRYYTDVIDGHYELSTIVAVRSFCEQNGLDVGNAATPEMQKLLYSDRAEYYAEPYVPLLIGPEFKVEEPIFASDDVGFVIPQVVNRSEDRAIRGYELCYYKTDVWGTIQKFDSGYTIGYFSQAQKIKAGYCEFVDTGVPVDPFANSYSVWIGVHKIVFDDGEIRELPMDQIRYVECRIHDD